MEYKCNWRYEVGKVCHLYDVISGQCNFVSERTSVNARVFFADLSIIK